MARQGPGASAQQRVAKAPAPKGRAEDAAPDRAERCSGVGLRPALGGALVIGPVVAGAVLAVVVMMMVAVVVVAVRIVGLRLNGSAGRGDSEDRRQGRE